MDRRARLELALDLLKAARELTAVAATMRGKRVATLRELGERLSSRGLGLVADDIQAVLGGEQP